jgi:hypothetical protein
MPYNILIDPNTPEGKRLLEEQKATPVGIALFIIFIIVFIYILNTFYKKFENQPKEPMFSNYLT